LVSDEWLYKCCNDVSKEFVKGIHSINASMWPGIYGNAGGSAAVVSNMRKRAVQASRFIYVADYAGPPFMLNRLKMRVKMVAPVNWNCRWLFAAFIWMFRWGTWIYMVSWVPVSCQTSYTSLRKKENCSI